MIEVGLGLVLVKSSCSSLVMLLNYPKTKLKSIRRRWERWNKRFTTDVEVIEDWYKLLIQFQSNKTNVLLNLNNQINNLCNKKWKLSFCCNISLSLPFVLRSSFVALDWPKTIRTIYWRFVCSGTALEPRFLRVIHSTGNFFV